MKWETFLFRNLPARCRWKAFRTFAVTRDTIATRVGRHEYLIVSDSNFRAGRLPKCVWLSLSLKNLSNLHIVKRFVCGVNKARNKLILPWNGKSMSYTSWYRVNIYVSK
jgi:hypothetical protein